MTKYLDYDETKSAIKEILQRSMVNSYSKGVILRKLSKEIKPY